MLSRRLVNWFLGSSAGALMLSAAYPILRFVTPPDVAEASTQQLDAGPTNDPELLSTGFKILRFGVEPVILLRVADDDFRAFSATCTHLDCIVEYQRTGHRIWCNCHNGEYDLHGKNVAGPPPRPLQEFKVDLVSDGPKRPKSIMVSRLRA